MSERMSQAAYAKTRTPPVSRQYINKLVHQGKIEVDEKKRVDPEQADKVLEELADPSQAKIEENTPPDEDGLGEDGQLGSSSQQPSSLMSQARISQVAYKAKLAQLDFEERAGKLVSVQDVEREAFEAARQVRDTLLSVPQEVAGVLVTMKDEKEIAVFLRSKLKDALMEAGANVGLSESE